MSKHTADAVSLLGLAGFVVLIFWLFPSDNIDRSVECVQASGVWIVSGPDAPYCQRGK